MTFTPDPGEEIAAALQAYLDDAARDFDADTGVNGQYTFSVPADPAEVMTRETDELRVYIVPVGHTETKQTRNTVFSTQAINVFVMCPITSTITRAKLNGLVYAMMVALRHQKMAGWTWASTTQIAKLDPDMLRERVQFATAFQLTYEAVE